MILLPYLLIVFSVLKRQTESLQQCITLLVSLSCGHEGDVHTLNAVYGVDVNLREDNLLLNTEGVVTTAVKLALNTLEVADTGQGHAHQLLQELVHALAAQRNHHADGHLLTQLEVGDVLLTLGFTAFLSITGLVSGSADALTVKAARSLIATAVPVVGRMLSDTADSVLTAASLVKNSAGAFGMIAVCAVCAAPFVSLAVHRLLLSVAAAAAEMMAGERLARLLNDLGGVMSMLLGLVGCFGLMLFFCIVAALRTVSG